MPLQRGRCLRTIQPISVEHAVFSMANVQGRTLHIVCTTAQATLIIITVYEPLPPKWTTPTQRRAS